MPTGDGFAEVLTQSVTSEVSFWNLSGYPSPGWPKAGTKEHFRSGAPPVAADLDGRGGSEVVALNASGIVDALKSDGGTLPGWPLATGIGAMGSPLLVDLTGDGTLDLVAARRAPRGCSAYSLPTPTGAAARVAWPDAGRRSREEFVARCRAHPDAAAADRGTAHRRLAQGHIPIPRGGGR